ncbi:MAG: hypothetical protein HC837_16480 [Chloroflexaceae bacterium]|nr:hypothetical protein [Chloroflexaceae bacterium]
MRTRYRVTLVLFLLLTLVPLTHQNILIDPFDQPLRAQQAQEPAASSSAFGLNTHIASRSIHQQTLNLAADVIDQSGAGWVREDFHWYRIEPQPGTYDWEFTDNTVLLLSERNINIIGVLFPAVGWATPFPGDQPDNVSYYPPDPARYAEFVTTVVSRYKDLVQHWEIWNEPDNPFYWQPQIDPAAYATLLKAAYPAVKAANPNAQVLLSGLVPFDLSFLRKLADEGAWQSFDILSLHPYGDPWSPEHGQIDAAGIGAVNILADQLGSKPIWVTEFGWASGPSDRDPLGLTNQETQANYLVRSMVLLRAAGAQRVLWYKLKDTDIANPYGLLHFGRELDDYSQPKPALAAFRTLNQQLAGLTPVGQLSRPEPQTVLDFESPANWHALDAQTTATESTLTPNQTHIHSGAAALQLDYRFPSGQAPSIGFAPQDAIALPGQPQRIGMWVSADGSGHSVAVRLIDAQGEPFQIRLGFAGHPGWQFLSAPISGKLPTYNQLDPTNQGNQQIDFPVSLTALVLNNTQKDRPSQGTLYLDDLSVIQTPDTYQMRFANESRIVDVLWSPQGAQARIVTPADHALLVQRSGESLLLSAHDGSVEVSLGPSPIYLNHLSPSSSNQPTTPDHNHALPDETPTELPAPSDGRFADETFRALWQRTDGPVAAHAAGLPNRSWVWGPGPLTNGLYEPFAQAPDGRRLVQYFDKSRMEINDPSAPFSPWFVTNGLLVVEMMTGQVQTGDSRYQQLEPASQAMAGDNIEVNPHAPTYQLFAQLSYPPNPQRATDRRGETVIEQIRITDGSLSIHKNANLAVYAIQIGDYDQNLGHNIPQVFLDFFQQQRLVQEDGQYVLRPLMDWVFVMGLPISEPYWVRVTVGGNEKDVLIQAFQRRIITYTPSSDPAWQVEMGNVGRHYMRWRYGW